MKIYVALVLLLGFQFASFSCASAASAETASAFQHEFMFAPSISYSTSRGLGLGASAGVGLMLGDHWEVEAELGYHGYSNVNWGTLQTSIGGKYNFSEDLLNSPFVSLGVVSVQDVYSPSTEGLYATAGWRVQIGDRNLAWTPGISAVFFNREAYLGLMLFNFATFF